MLEELEINILEESLQIMYPMPMNRKWPRYFDHDSTYWVEWWFEIVQVLAGVSDGDCSITFAQKSYYEDTNFSDATFQRIISNAPSDKSVYNSEVQVYQN